MERKGQASVEYLIILAVVIIIALVVVGVLGGFPQLTAGISSRESAAYWLAADIGITKYIENSTGLFVFVRNNRPFTITFNHSFIDAAYNTTSKTGSLTSGSESTIWLLTTAATCTSGNQFSNTITFGYFDDKGGFYNFTGAKRLVGSC